MPTQINVQNLNKHFGNLHAVKGISFSLSRGEVLGFIGPNGAGKSTTMKMITGYLTPDSGSIEIQSKPLLEQPLFAKKQIGYLPEGAPSYPDMTPAQFLQFIGKIYGLQGRTLQQRVDKMLKQLHLVEVKDQTIETLSKGFKRRVSLAQALINDPPILILDEPTDGLDPNQKQEVRALIKSMAADKAIILSTHILEEVEALCNRVIIIADGEIVANSTPAELCKQSKWHNALTLTIHHSVFEQVKKALKKLKQLASYEVLQANNDCISLRLLPVAGKRLWEEVYHLASEYQWEIEELHNEQGHIEAVFQDLTQTAR